MIAASIYKRILKKLNLTKEELQELKNNLHEEQICYGPFIKQDKTCPNTTALQIKAKKKFVSSRQVSEQLRILRVSKIDLALFYITFDVPVIIFPRLFERYLQSFRKVIEELMIE